MNDNNVFFTSPIAFKYNKNLMLKSLLAEQTISSYLAQTTDLTESSWPVNLN